MFSGEKLSQAEQKNQQGIDIKSFYLSPSHGFEYKKTA